MLNRIGKGLKNIKTALRDNRAMGLWEAKKYEKLANMFKKLNDYSAFKINQYSLIHFLINQKDKEAVDILLQKIPYKQQALQDDNNPMTISPICYAFLQGDAEMVKIVQKHGGDINKPNRLAQNVLHLAAIYKREQAFKNGVIQNANINLEDEFGNTPFHYAARAGSVEMTSVMISSKAKKTQNKIFQYPVHMAIQSASLETFELLANDVMGIYSKFHPIHSAARCSNQGTLKRVLKLKPSSLNFKDYKGLTALHHAILVEDNDMVRALIKEPGILVNEPDEYGNTPLHLAMMNENLQLAQLLLESKANLDTTNQDNLSPADYGITSKNKQIHSLLLKWQQKSKKVNEWVSSKY